MPTTQTSAHPATPPPPPAPGTAFSHAYLPHVAVDNHDGEILRAMMATAISASLGKGYDYLTIGFSKRNPLLDVAKRNFKYLEYRSLLGLLHWEDGAKAADELDDRIPHIEIAVL